MNNILRTLSKISRQLGLIRVSDGLHYYVERVLTYESRKSFKRENNQIAIPPDYALYETFKLDYHRYYFGGKESAKWVVSIISKYKEANNLKVLDWGCGVGRVVRHVPGYLNDSSSIYATDYNASYIDWCKLNIPSVHFASNNLSPPLVFDDGAFDVVYGISIFTHLSEALHTLWFKELMRVLKTDGILILTLHGDAFRGFLSKNNREKYDKGELVINDNTKIGHRTFGAFHPKKYVTGLMGNNVLLEHVKGEVSNGKLAQDVWVIKKA